MHTFFRAIALGAAVSVASADVALAAAVDSFKPSPALNFTKIALANGENVYCRKAGGTQWKVFIVTRDGKYVPAPPGSYKQKNGNVIVVGAGGLTSPGSKVMLNPQPLPP
jgi:hypothetical protein